MRIAVMQPYLFPYIGYFQLMRAVDKFVVLDDVTFIQRGWINRNRVLVNHRPHTFTIPIERVSQNKLITELNMVQQDGWRDKLLKTLTFAYKRAPFFESVYPLIERTILFPGRMLVDFIGNSLFELHCYLGLETGLVKTSRVYNNRNLIGEERILDICRREGGSEYINPIGGTTLYSIHCFAGAGVKLRFLKPGTIRYRQFGVEFVPSLSIIDVLMFNGPRRTAEYLSDYELISGEAA
jgi:hypothetical protein